MNSKSLLSVIVGLSSSLFAVPAVADDCCDVINLDARASQHDCRPDEVIVKFKSGSRANMRARQNAVASTGVTTVDEVFKKLGVSEAEPLMPLTGAQSFARKQRAYNGRDVATPSFEKAYRVKFSSGSVSEAVKLLSALPDVEFAEPNYLVHSLATEGEDINDPYYSLQYGINDINLNNLWGAPVLSKEGPVIAIVDTGVDIAHPDLEKNIWVNPAETGGASGYDDDGNGFVDDLYGYDFVNQTGVLADYNGHGTHCAGIAAATGHNGLGIIGANPDARIMPLTVLQSNGSGDIATIIKAIDYAAANGADIISMSLGTYANSIAFEQALGRAYQKCIIVAAAGNDGLCIYPEHKGGTMFPAAYTFVLGVQASAQGGTRAGFSNYDCDGPIFTKFGEERLYNYELMAPGASIMSTYPNGQYKRLNGTSMATPLVAGALSRLLQAKEYSNREVLFGDLINTAKDGILDIYAAYNITDADRKPSIQIIGNRLADADGDGRADAGETIEFYPTIRNIWGNAADIKLTLECNEPVNSFCEFLDTEADFGQTLSAYGKGESVNPLRLRIKDDVVDGRVCCLKLIASCPDAPTVEQEFEVKVENGVEIGGILNEDMTLTPDKNYIVTKLLGVPEGRTLTIQPGTTIKFKDGTGLSVADGGRLVAKGEPGNMITFTKADLDLGEIEYFDTGNSNLCEYCIVENLLFKYTGLSDTHDFNGKNSIYRNNSGWAIFNNSIFDYSEFEDCNTYNNIGYSLNLSVNRNCNVINNELISFDNYSFIQATDTKSSNVFSNINGDIIGSLAHYTETPAVFTPVEPNYLGSADKKIVQSHVFDINYPGSDSMGEYDLTNMLTRPNPNTHGIVWKVLVDGYDAQDEFDKLPPLGVGRHKFEVFYNRVIDESETPTIAMGVRPPYTQTSISADGSWRTENLPYSPDGNNNNERMVPVSVYTAYLDITGKMSIDGLNRIYVGGGRDLDYFPIIVEDKRFNVNVQAAGSLSTGFFGEAGLGRVNLAWEDLDLNFEDIMGYNMYRINPDSEEAVKINDHLIEAGTTTYTDYDVTPGKTYQYYYKVMTTDLKENDPSKIVAVTPLTSTLGDSNGSGSVDVADVLTTVNYASGMDPKPFIHEAADVNTDTMIDILDVVGTVNIIMGTPDESMIMAANEAVLTVEDDTLYIDTPVELAGLQFDFSTIPGCNIKVLDALNGFETTGSWRSEDTYRFMAYNLNGKTLSVGKHALLNIAGSDVTDARLSDAYGLNVDVVYGSATGIDIANKDNSLKANAQPGVYNLMGVKVGENSSDLERQPAGIYILNGWKVVKR